MSGQRSEEGSTDGSGGRGSDCCSTDEVGSPADCCTVDLSEEDLATDVQTLATLGNDTRYEALRLIAGVEGGVCVCELEPELGVSQGAVSQALSRLFSAGLVDRRKEGRWRYYTATDRAERLLDALDEVRSLEGGRES